MVAIARGLISTKEKTMKSSIVLLVIFVLGANESYAATGSTGYVDIQTIRVGGGFLRVTGITDFIDPSNCNGSGANANRNIVVLEGTPSYKEILSFVLSAKMTNRAIQFWVDGCATDSGNLYPNAKYVYVQ